MHPFVRANASRRTERPVEEEGSLAVAAFFYGSYMDPQVLKRFGATPTAPQPARLQGWRLTFTPHANLVPDPDGLVHGLLYELPHGELERLYGPSGFVTTYKPVPALVQTEAADVAALTFVERATEAAPEPEYLEALLEICARLGLPAAYIQDLEQQARRLAAIAV